MPVNKKINTIDSKIEQNKAQYNLDKHTAKILALSWGKVGRYAFLIGKDVLSMKELLEKPAKIKKLECSPLGSELKKAK